jgi:hypothetical protein
MNLAPDADYNSVGHDNHKWILDTHDRFFNEQSRRSLDGRQRAKNIGAMG